MVIATATIAASFGRVAAAFAAEASALVGDATAVFRVLYGLDDGNDYGRYFAGQNPLQPFFGSETSVATMVALGVTQRQAVGAAGGALITAAASGIQGFGAAADGFTETVRQACADPRDALRVLARLCTFQMYRKASGIPADGLGLELYVLTARAVLRVRIAAAASLVRATADYRPDSQRSAQLVRDRVGDLLDALATKSADLFDDRTAKAIDAARVAVVQDLTARGADLAPIVVRQVGAPLPAKVLAYRFYDDTTRAGELLARNDPPHPSFMPVVIEAAAA